MPNSPRRRFLVPAFAIAASAAVFMAASTARAIAQEQAPAAAQKEQTAEEEHSPLHQSMEAMNDRLRSLRKLLKAPDQKDEAIKLCREMEQFALQGFGQLPEPTEALEGVALIEFEVDFRRRMLVVAQTLLDLEVALAKEDLDAAKGLYRTLGAQKKDGHNVYIK